MCRLPPAVTRAPQWELRPHHKRMALSLCSGRSPGAERTYWLISVISISPCQPPGRNGRKGQKQAWGFVPPWQWGPSCDPMQSLTSPSSCSKPGVPDSRQPLTSFPWALSRQRGRGRRWGRFPSNYMRGLKEFNLWLLQWDWSCRRFTLEPVWRRAHGGETSWKDWAEFRGMVRRGCTEAPTRGWGGAERPASRGGGGTHELPDGRLVWTRWLWRLPWACAWSVMSFLKEAVGR